MNDVRRAEGQKVQASPYSPQFQEKIALFGQALRVGHLPHNFSDAGYLSPDIPKTGGELADDSFGDRAWIGPQPE